MFKPMKLLVPVMLAASMMLAAPVTAQAAPYPGPSVKYKSPNPSTLKGRPWYCFQYSYSGVAPGTGFYLYKVWCPKNVEPGRVYGNDGRWYSKYEGTSCDTLQKAKGGPACTSRWKSYPYVTRG